MISEKDRGQLLRMAGNIACGLTQGMNIHDITDEKSFLAVGRISAKIAMKTLQAVDWEIEDARKDVE